MNRINHSSRFISQFGNIAQVTVKEVADEVFAGGDKPDDMSELKNNEYRYPVFSNGIGNNAELGFSRECRVHKQAITISARGTIGYAEIRDGGFTPVVRLLTLIPKAKYSLPFLKYALNQITYRTSGSSIGQLPVPDFIKLTVPDADLNEQKEFESLYHQADKSKFFGFKSRFIEIFGDLTKNTKSIPITTIGELFEVGSSKRVFEKDWTSSGVPFYRAREIVKLAKDGFVDNELFITESMYEEYSRKYGIPVVGDIMVTGVGTLGVCYLVKEGDRFYYKDGNTICLHSLGKIDSRFVVECYGMPFVIDQIEGNANVTTVGTYTIDKARKTRIPWPSPRLQNLFLSTVYQADKSKLLN